MGNFNINYNPAKVYSDSEESELKDKVSLSTIIVFTEFNTSTKVNNPIKTNVKSSKVNNLAYNIVNNNFDSLCLPYTTSKQTRIIIQNKSMRKVEGKFDKMYMNL